MMDRKLVQDVTQPFPLAAGIGFRPPWFEAGLGRYKDTWDPFQLNPVGSEKEEKQRCFLLAQYLVAVIVGVAVLVSAVVAKGSLLVLSTLASPKSERDNQEQQFYMLMLVFCLVFPNFLVFLKSLWHCAFRKFVVPNMKTMGFICAIECLVSLGTSVLVLIVMPQFDILTNLFISGGVCIVSAVLQILYRLQRESWKILFPICSLLLTSAGYCLLGMDYYVRESSKVDRQSKDCFYYVGVGIFSSLLISFCWWENTMQAKNRMQKTLSELEGFKDFVFVISSILRILIIGAVYLIYYAAIQKSIKWSDFNLANKEQELLQIGLVLLFLQAFCSAACHWFGVVACKIHAVRMSFALPLCCTGPTVLGLGMVLFLTQAKYLEHTKSASILEFCANLHLVKDKNTTNVVMFEMSRSICRTMLNSYYFQWPFVMLALEGVCMWAGFVTCTYYVWKIKVQRIERTSQLFVRRLYESAFIDLSLLLNTKMKLPKAQTNESQDELQSVVIYLCATMWHETYDEMLKILTSMFRLDRYRGDPKEEHKDSFDFECHILVDDAFMTEKETGKRLVNEYVEDLIHVVTEVYRVFTNKEPDDVSIIETPYGGRLMFVLPEGNMLYVHLKDKQLIRNKKRWSQRMETSRESLISMDGEIFLLPQFDNDNKRRFISDDNTYILALDGDTDFHPKAVVLLVDRLRMYYNVGAACGRIHPTGMGPMVWYQKFEYAVGHWLQKTAEHVFGSVLCSPGCFSLFRGSALMDDNVLKKYTTTATRGAEYVQYDQGAIQFIFKIDGAISIIVSCVPPVFYIIICFATKANTQITIAAIMSVLYAFLMTASFFSIIGDMVVQGTFLTPTGLFLVSMAIMYMVTALLHPQEFGLIIYGLMYFICIPSGYLLLIIYSLVNMNNVSWGTRESKEEGEEKKSKSIVCDKDCRLCCWDMKIQITNEAENTMVQQIVGLAGQKAPLLQLTNRETQPQAASNPDPQAKPETTTKKDEEVKNPPADINKKAASKDLNFSTTHDDKDEERSIISHSSDSSNSSDASHSSDLSDQDDDFMNDDLEYTEDIPIKDWVAPVKTEFLKKLTYFNMKRNLQAQIRYTLRHKNQDDVCEDLVLMLTDTLNIKLSKAKPEDILEQAELDELQHELTNQARHILKNNKMMKLEKRVKRAIEKTLSAPQVQRLDESEKDFWDKLIERYLTPISDSKEHKLRVSKELRSLRNKAVFLYFIINVLWVVATFFLQLIGNDIISIRIPKYSPDGNITGELKVEPLSLMFLFSFAVLLLVQFIAMLYHRVYTLIHVVSYRSTEKNYKERDLEDEEEDPTIENQYAISISSEDFQL
ncbi:hypothetical protein CRENBAI_011615 [Crenichthys baileyi]|uniref:chitin synthase n=1 Tax=Crenichthys baileyi TaxID=28760 RepID=A0AAV9SK84_9TELE